MIHIDEIIEEMEKHKAHAKLYNDLHTFLQEYPFKQDILIALDAHRPNAMSDRDRLAYKIYKDYLTTIGTGCGNLSEAYVEYVFSGIVLHFRDINLVSPRFYLADIFNHSKVVLSVAEFFQKRGHYDEHQRH